jgi:uncharacterized protein YndB with AHSA1/START domain
MAEIKKLGFSSTESVKKATGKSWRQWVDILEKVGGRVLTHQEIVKLLKTKYKLKPWWQQQVTCGYEEHIGRRLPGRNGKGLFSATITKTLKFDQKSVWRFLASQEGIQIWLNPMSDFVLAPKNSFEVEGGIFGEVRTIKAPTRVRMTWQDSDWDKTTVFQIYVIPKGKNRSMLVFNHDNIVTAAIKASLRQRWRKAIEDIDDFLKTKSK